MIPGIAPALIIVSGSIVPGLIGIIIILILLLIALRLAGIIS